MKCSVLQCDLKTYHYRIHSEVPLTRWRLIRYALSFKMLPVTLLRLSTCLKRMSIPVLPRICQLLNFIIYGFESRPKCVIGAGLFLPHTQGTVIGARSIGINCTIYQGVTIGASKVDLADTDELRPIIEDDVTIGSGAKVLGAITIGRGSTIGANVVVTSDVPPGTLVVAGHPVHRSKCI